MTDPTKRILTAGEFSKVDEDKRLVYGWASVVTEGGMPVVDLQGDMLDIDDLQKATHAFMATGRAAGQNHERSEDGIVAYGKIVEAVVFTEDLQSALGIHLGKTGLFIAVKVDDDEVWKSVKNGGLKAFSIGGRGQRKEILA